MSCQPPRPAGAQGVLTSTDIIGFLDPESTVKPHHGRSPCLAPLLSKERRCLWYSRGGLDPGESGENRCVSACGRAALGAPPQRRWSAVL